MSTLKVTNIESPSGGGVSAKINDIGGGQLSNRNLIINGAMVVSQRGTSHTSQHNVDNYGIDRWQVICPNTSAVLVHSQETTGGPDGFKNWLKISPSTADTSIAANNYSSVLQKIEGYNFISANYGTANAQNVTVSFKFKTNKAGTYCMCHRNNLADRNYIHEFTPVADGSWQTITYTVPGDTTGTWDTTNNVGWRFELFMANGTNNQSNTTDTWFQGQFYHATPNQVNFLDSTSNELGITGVQVEVGDIATSFEHRSYADELRLSRRYFEKVFVSGLAANRNSFFGEYLVYVPFKETKRPKNPLLFYGSSVGNYQPGGGTGTITTRFITIDGCLINTGSPNTNTSYIPNFINDGNAHFTIDAEL